MLRTKTITEELEWIAEPFHLFKRLKGLPYPFFLDSSCAFTNLGRFSFLSCDPFLIFKSKGDHITLESASGRKETFISNPFYVLKDIFKRYEVAGDKEGLPFTSGAVGYFAYDMKDHIERLPDTAIDDMGLPDCILAFYDTVIASDNLKRRIYIASSSRKVSRLKRYKEILYGPADEAERQYVLSPPVIKSNFSKAAYMNAVEKAKMYIKSGDIYQVNLSQRFCADFDSDPIQMYSVLRSVSPAPFASYLDLKDVVILSSSPERFLSKRKDYIETRPIKGTRPRGKDRTEDLLLENELRNSPKDRAEHIMIVDLERNDLGRICEYGSVRPIETLVLERYSNVFHLVSTITGRLKKDIEPIDCLLAAFPGGSITGAPKIRSMEIIEELEPVKRSIYTGAIGYIAFNGNMDASIVIRTFIIKNSKIYFQAGGGIVADSDPEKEYEETLHKARGLMQALGSLPAGALSVKGITSGAGIGQD